MIISWNTTNACNMYCKHCYRDAGCKAEEELSTAEAKKLLDEIARAGFKIMIFSGGEPLTRPDILELVAHATKLGLRSVFGTNGTLITPEMAHGLKAAGAMGMGISLDSMSPAKHDTFRSYPGGWAGAVEGMKNCRAVGLPFQIHTTVMDWNEKELEAITDFAVELGAVAHHFFFLVPTGRAETIEEERADAHHEEVGGGRDRAEADVRAAVLAHRGPDGHQDALSARLSRRSQLLHHQPARQGAAVRLSQHGAGRCAKDAVRRDLEEQRGAEQAAHARILGRLRHLRLQACLRRLPCARSLL